MTPVVNLVKTVPSGKLGKLLLVP